MTEDEANVSLFVSPSKKTIFEYICNNPGSYLFEIVGEVDMPTMTVKRYLERLVEVGIVCVMKFKGKSIYYPRGLREEDVEAAYSQLRHEERKKIFLYLLNNPGATRSDIITYISISQRQVCRLLDAMEDAGLIVHYDEGKAYKYDIGEVGKKIVVGSIESLTPFLDSIRDSTGFDVSIDMEYVGGKSIARITIVDGDSIRVELGRWNMVEIEEKDIVENARIILAEGGKDVLLALNAGCTDEQQIYLFTGTKPRIIRAKMRTLRLFGLVIDYTITELGTKVVNKIKKMEWD